MSGGGDDDKAVVSDFLTCTLPWIMRFLTICGWVAHLYKAFFIQHFSSKQLVAHNGTNLGSEVAFGKNIYIYI